MAGMMPPGMPGQNVVPFPGMGQPMMPNPAFAQWRQQAEAWQQEHQRRQQEFLSACGYIQKDAHKRFNIDIEADSTIAPDEEAEKAARTQFLQAITPFMESVIPLAVQNPPLAPLVKEMIIFAVRAFKVSRQLEDAFEEALDRMMQMPPPQQQPQGGRNTKSPQEIQSEQQIAQMKTQADMVDTQMQAKVAAGAQQAAMQKNAIEMMKLFAGQGQQSAQLQQDAQFKGADLALRQREAAMRESLAQARMQHLDVADERGMV